MWIGQKGGNRLHRPPPSQEGSNPCKRLFHRTHLPDTHTLKTKPYRLREDRVRLAPPGSEGNERDAKTQQQKGGRPYAEASQTQAQIRFHA